MKRVVSVFILLCSIALTAYATTPAKGVFSVSPTKKVQFANAGQHPAIAVIGDSTFTHSGMTVLMHPPR